MCSCTFLASLMALINSSADQASSNSKLLLVKGIYTITLKPQVRVNNTEVSHNKSLNYTAMSVLLKNTPLVKAYKTTSRTQEAYLLVRILIHDIIFHFFIVCANSCSLSRYNKGKEITWWLEVMNFIFSCLRQSLFTHCAPA